MNQQSAIELFRDLMDLSGGIADDGKMSAFGMAFRCFSDEERVYPNQPSEDYGLTGPTECRTRCANFLRQWADDIEGRKCPDIIYDDDITHAVDKAQAVIEKYIDLNHGIPYTTGARDLALKIIEALPQSSSRPQTDDPAEGE